MATHGIYKRGNGDLMENEHTKTSRTHNQDIIESEIKNNYGGKYLVNKNLMYCYTKKQMKSLYPSKNFKRIGEYAPYSKKEKCAVLRHGKLHLPLSKYGSHSRILYQEKGCVLVGTEDDSFVALLKKAALPRVASFALCLMLIAGATVLALNMDKPEVASIAEEEIAAAASIPIELEEGAVDWEGVQQKDTGGVTAGIAIPGYKSITIDANKTDVKVNLQNPEGNPCYFVISLVLDDGTQLYKSKMVEPGKGLYDITLTQPLAKGEYGAMVKYETFSLQDSSSMNRAQVKIILIAQ